MNASYDEDQNDLRYAEYVLGVLDADARASVAHEVATSDAAAVAVALWQRRLTPLVEVLPEVAPSEDVWIRIREALSWDVPRSTNRPMSFWNSARPWQWLSGVASLAAAVCVVMLLRAPVREAPEAAHVGVMVSSMRQDNGVTDWTATLDLDRKQIVVVPAAVAAVPAGRSTQLWLIPAGAAPISVGVFAPDRTVVLALSAQLLAQLRPTAALAVSVEPPGGSPTGQPTGPVIASGALSSAPSPAATG
jgi:anti-sigma-K factor RskA